jgi:hypothetical protein
MRSSPKSQGCRPIIFEHGDLGDRNDEAGTGDEVLRRFEALEGEAQTAFYNEHRAEIHRGHEARKSNNP